MFGGWLRRSRGGCRIRLSLIAASTIFVPAVVEGRTLAASRKKNFPQRTSFEDDKKLIYESRPTSNEVDVIRSANRDSARAIWHDEWPNRTAAVGACQMKWILVVDRLTR